jgi:hypothetical protein
LSNEAVGGLAMRLIVAAIVMLSLYVLPAHSGEAFDKFMAQQKDPAYQAEQAQADAKALEYRLQSARRAAEAEAFFATPNTPYPDTPQMKIDTPPDPPLAPFPQSFICMSSGNLTFCN